MAARPLIVIGALCLGACQTTISGQSARCSGLIPEHWKAGVEGAEIPATDHLRDWQKGFVDQSIQLEKANGRVTDTIAIVSGCEGLVNASRERKRFLGLF